MGTIERDRYIKIAIAAGCPRDQLANFRQGHYCAQRKQVPFHAAAREADAADGPTQIGQGGARGGAKSHAAVCQMVLDDCERVPGSKWLYLRSVGASARESFEDMLTKALPGMMQYYVRIRSALELPTGSKVILGGFRNERDIDKYMGIEYDGILIDDAHLISKAKYDRVRGSLRTSKENWRPRTYVTFNPGGIGHAHLKRLFVEPWRQKREADTRFFFSLPEDNAFLNPEYVEYLESLSGWLYRAWRHGDFDIAAGQFFTNWRREVHVVEPFRPPIDWRWWLAMDYGFQHWNVIYLMCLSGDGMLYIVDELARRQTLVEHIARDTRAMTERWAITDRIKMFRAGADVFAKDRDGASVADDWERQGYELTAANQDRINGAAEVMRRLGDVERGIKPTIAIFDNCTKLIECLPSLEHDPRRPEDVKKRDTDDDGEGGDDPYDCARYGIMEAARKRFAGVTVVQY